MPTTYIIEAAKSGRSACKVCKTKIEKGELRIGSVSDNDGRVMTSWRKPLCFSLPRRFKQDVDSFFEELEGFSELDDTVASQLRTDILTKKPKGKSKSKDAPPSTPLDASVAFLKSIGYGKKRPLEPENQPRPFKRLKVENDQHDQENLPELQQMLKSQFPKQSPKDIVINFHYNNMKNDELKEILRWNHQLVGGTKSELVARCIDGHLFGAIPQCPLCKGGEGIDGDTKRKRTKLKYDPKTKIYTCGGYHDGSSQIFCSFASRNVLRTDWIDTIEDYKRSEIEHDAKVKEEKKNSTNEVKTLLVDCGALDEDIDAKTRTKRLATLAVKLGCTDSAGLKMKIYSMLQAAEGSIEENCVSVINEIKPSEPVQDSSSSSTESGLNGALVAVMIEMGALYYKAGLNFKGTAWKKAAAEVQMLDYKVTDGLAMAKKKTKVKGVGKGIATRVQEWLDTGKMTKLEELKEEFGN